MAAGAWAEGSDAVFLAVMQQSGLVPDVITYEAPLTACEKE
jgi:hypothetical protein